MATAQAGKKWWFQKLEKAASELDREGRRKRPMQGWRAWQRSASSAEVRHYTLSSRRELYWSYVFSVDFYAGRQQDTCRIFQPLSLQLPDATPRLVLPDTVLRIGSVMAYCRLSYSPAGDCCEVFDVGLTIPAKSLDAPTLRWAFSAVEHDSDLALDILENELAKQPA